jgi:hypothetical protein
MLTWRTSSGTALRCDGRTAARFGLLAFDSGGVVLGGLTGRGLALAFNDVLLQG